MHDFIAYYKVTLLFIEGPKGCFISHIVKLNLEKETQCLPVATLGQMFLITVLQPVTHSDANILHSQLYKEKSEQRVCYRAAYLVLYILCS